MEKLELLYLRKKLLEESIKGERIRKLQENPNVLEYMKLVGISKFKIATDKEILEKILENYKLTSTNNIWILTGTYKLDFGICYEETCTRREYVDLLRRDADVREYVNIESLAYKQASFERKQNLYSVDDFERENIVLNPFDGKKEKNGLTYVRNEFILNSINMGEQTAKEKLLRKYKRIKN